MIGTLLVRFIHSYLYIWHNLLLQKVQLQLILSCVISLCKIYGMSSKIVHVVMMI